MFLMKISMQLEIMYSLMSGAEKFLCLLLKTGAIGMSSHPYSGMARMALR